MSWVNKHKLPAIKAIKYNGQPCLTINNLWNALHLTFNTALHHQVDINILDEVTDRSSSSWILFSKEEFKGAIANCNNSSTAELDKLLWSHLKTILKDNSYLSNIISIANACINLEFWLSHFKRFTTVVIPKPNKQSYDSPKLFRPIILLNMLSKLIKKVISKRLQFLTTLNDFIHPSQLGGLKFKSMTDVGVALTHIIQSGWVKNLLTSTLAFNITQFFPSLNYRLLTLILKKVEFDNHIVSFFANYLMDRKMNYFWNSFNFPLFDVNIGIGQGFMLSPILSVLYFSPLLYILEKYLKNLKILISIILFVDDGLFISQSKSFHISNCCLFCSYNVISNLLEKFSLIVEHFKTEVFHFNRSQGVFNPPPLNLSPTIQKYVEILGFHIQ